MPRARRSRMRGSRACAHVSSKGDGPATASPGIRPARVPDRHVSPHARQRHWIDSPNTRRAGALGTRPASVRLGTLVNWTSSLVQRGQRRSAWLGRGAVRPAAELIQALVPVRTARNSALASSPPTSASSARQPRNTAVVPARAGTYRRTQRGRRSITAASAAAPGDRRRSNS